ncbi:MAG: tetratricopeptide repeat protein [Terriglobales bacterium]
MFARARHELAENHLDAAARDFQRVLAQDPHQMGAYANLGVIAMRRHQWAAAHRWLRQAERLSPNVPGLKLDLGLSYYQQGRYRSAVPYFHAVLTAQPANRQARYLLGLCQFFNGGYAAAAHTLAPLWAQENRQVSYLYILAVAAGNAHQTALRDRAAHRLLAIGRQTPEFHLLMGRAFLNKQQYPQARDAFQAAVAADPKLPMVHFNLGVVYQRLHQFARARQEFLADIALEPGVAYNYSHLGQVLAATGHPEKARRAFEHALRLNPALAAADFGLGRLDLSARRYPAAITLLQRAARLKPRSTSVHNLLGQAYLRSGQRRQARAEFARAARLRRAAAAKLQREISGPQH